MTINTVLLIVASTLFLCGMLVLVANHGEWWRIAIGVVFAAVGFATARAAFE
jgi:uncharacterized BrkB/YihY/UPF0761 family membrane protein